MIRTPQLKTLVTARFSAPEWGLVWEVPNGTGADKSRTIDALAMSLWPSRGLELHGLELKTSRSDLTKELRNPEKAEAVGRFCDRFWIVAPKGLAKPEDMPAAWGLLEATPRRLRLAKVAAKLEPADVNRAFLAAIFRRVAVVTSGYVARSEIADKMNAEYQRGVDYERASADRRSNNRSGDFVALARKVEEFEQAAGVKIDRWQHGQIGAAVRMVLAGEHKGRAAEMKRIAARIRGAGTDLEGAVKEWEAL